MPSRDALPRRLPISTRAVLEPGGAERRDLHVFCPKHQATADIEACTRCPSCAGLDAEPDASRRPAVHCAYERPTPAEATRPVGAVLARFALAVHVAALPRTASATPYGSPIAVVDDELRLVGVFERGGTIRPDDGSLSLAIDEHLPLDAAVARLARMRHRSSPVVSASGTFLGAFDDLDALRALREIRGA